MKSAIWWLVVAAALAGGFVEQLAGQSRTARPWTMPRLTDGAPDLEGVWNYGTATPLERPSQWAGRATLTEDEALAWEKQSAERRNAGNATAGPDWWEPQNGILKNRRTSLIVDPPDGRLPPASASAARRPRGARDNNYDNPEELSLQERCIAWPAAAPPYAPTVYNNNIGILQAHDFVVLQSEMIHVARIVRMNASHGSMRSMYGDSIGRWEGTTLVVDTINFDGRLNYRNTGDHLHLVERFARTGSNTLEYEFTVDDPQTWTKPWTARIDMTMSDGPIYEFACHEGNASSVTATLKGSRLDDRPQH